MVGKEWLGGSETTSMNDEGNRTAVGRRKNGRLSGHSTSDEIKYP
jgi:hypothetical protein